MSASPSSSSAASEPIATPEHAHYCFDVLAAHLSPVSPPYAASSPPEPRFANAADAYAVFVTWETLRAGREPRLRGCIGNFAPRELGSQLREYAIVAALEDSRFRPIKASELPTLGCGVSILTPFEDCAHPLDWDVGTHGIYLSFKPPSSARTLTATYLPQIAPEQGWTKEETLASALHKAGFRGALTDVWRAEDDGEDPAELRRLGRGSLTVRRYRSEKSEVSWAEWADARGAR